MLLDLSGFLLVDLFVTVDLVVLKDFVEYRHPSSLVRNRLFHKLLSLFLYRANLIDIHQPTRNHLPFSLLLYLETTRHVHLRQDVLQIDT